MTGPVLRMLVILPAMLVASPGIDSADAADGELEAKVDSIFMEMNEGSSRAFSGAIDAGALLSRVFDGLDVTPGLKARYSDTIRRGVPQLGENARKRMPEGEFAKVLKVRREGEKATALVRFGFGNGNFGYNRYDLEIDSAGDIRIVDWLDYLEGERYSESVRRSVVTNQPTAGSVRGLVPDHDGSDEEYARLAEVMTAYRTKDYQKFYNDSATLSRALRGSRFMHLLTCQVSRMTRDRNLYLQAYRALANNFGDDPQVVFQLLSYYFSRGDYEEVNRALRMLQEDFGVRDAALLALMSRTSLGLRNVDEAAVLAEEAISLEPGLHTAYWAAINAHVMMRRFSFAVMTARSLEDQTGEPLDTEQFEKNAMYGEFIKSPQYKQWQSAKD
ncbi:MAG: tetratricopeptide repeat protein [Woeseia sp.]